MSSKERRRLEVFDRVRDGELSLVRAAELLGLSYRQTRRSDRRFREEGDAGLATRGEFEMAKVPYERSLGIAPKEPIVANNLAVVLLESKSEAKRALDLARRAFADLPGHPRVLATLGWAEWRDGDAEAGERHLRRSIRLSPNDPWSRRLLGQLLVEREPEAAEVQFEAARQLEPPSSEDGATD